MNRLLSFLSIFTVIILMVTSCAHLSRRQCETKNWCQQGFDDGTMGRQPQDLVEPTQACAKFNLRVDHQCYRKKWLEGAKYYCNPNYQQGLKDGKRGKTLETLVMDRRPFCKQAELTLNINDYKSGLIAGLAQPCTYKSGYTIGLRGYQLPNGNQPHVCPGALRVKFMSGWRAGVRKFCKQSHKAFLLGKKGQFYPEACIASNYPIFKREYERGYLVYQRTISLHNKIDSLNLKILDEAVKWGFAKDVHANNYYLGSNKSYEAEKALQNVRRMLSQINDWHAQLLQEHKAK